MSGTTVKDMVLGAEALAEYAHVAARGFGVLVGLHTEHCPKDKLDGFVRQAALPPRPNADDGAPPAPLGGAGVGSADLCPARLAPMVARIEVREPDVVGELWVPESPGPHPGVVALSGSGGGIPAWWGSLLAPRGIAVLAAAYFGVEPLPAVLCEAPLETVVSAAAWLQGRPEVRAGPVGLVGGSKGAELALLAASMLPDAFGPVAAIAPQSVAWFGYDPTGTVAGLSLRSSWSLDGVPVPFVPAVPGVTMERTGLGLRSIGVYLAALEQADAVKAAAIPVERARGPLLLLSGGQDAACPSSAMAEMICERMAAHGRRQDVQHLHFPECGHVVVRPWPAGQMPPTPFDNGGTPEALDAAHEIALPAVAAHLIEPS